MSFTRTIRDIESVEPSELNGIATGDLPADGNSSGVQVSNVGGTILFELADGGGGVTLAIQGTAPDSPTAGALWYDNTGDDEDLTSQLYIATVVAQDGGNDVVAWVPASPAPSVPSLPAMAAAGNYQLTVGADSALSWTAIGGGGGGGGGAGVGTYTSAFDGNMSAAPDNQLVMEAGKSYRLRIDFTQANIWWGVESGFENFAGGWYKAREREFRTVDSPDASDQVWEVDAQFMGTATGFRAAYRGSPFLQPASLTTWSAAQGTNPANNFTGITSPGVMRQGGFFEGEFQIGADGDVVWAVYASATDTGREINNSRTAGTNVFLAEIT